MDCRAPSYSVLLCSCSPSCSRELFPCCGGTSLVRRGRCQQLRVLLWLISQRLPALCSPACRQSRALTYRSRNFFRQDFESGLGARLSWQRKSVESLKVLYRRGTTGTRREGPMSSSACRAHVAPLPPRAFARLPRRRRRNGTTTRPIRAQRVHTAVLYSSEQHCSPRTTRTGSWSAWRQDNRRLSCPGLTSSLSSLTVSFHPTSALKSV